jgi:hypothetical protein
MLFRPNIEQQDDRPIERATSGRIRSRFFIAVVLEEAAAGGGSKAQTCQPGEGKKFGHDANMLE